MLVAHSITLALASGGLFTVTNGIRAEEFMVLEEITVTAEKRAEKPQDVPVSVTAFSSEAIVEAGIENTRDFIELTPNVTLDDVYSIGATHMTIRGVGQLNNADSPATIVVDGVPQNDQKQFQQELFDIERIEVLRGPQGSAYGRNAIGGAIDIVTKGPTNEQEGYVKTGLFNGNGKVVNGAISGPLIEDTLLYRLAGSYKKSDGLIDNTFLNTEIDFYESTDLRAQLKWLATDDVSLDLRYETSELDGGAIYHTDVTGGGTTVHSNIFVNPINNRLGRGERKMDSFTVKADADFSAGTLTYILGYTDLDEYYVGDLDFSSSTSEPDLVQSKSEDLEFLSHEVRWMSPDNRPFRWIIGTFHQETDRTVRNYLSGALINDDDNEVQAFFGQAEYDFTDRLELSGSIRHDRDERKQVSSSREETFSAWQPKATLTYKLTDDNLVYTTYGTGFRSGGFNADGTIYQKEIVKNYEIGSKNTFFDRHLVLNAAAYFAKSDDFQFFFYDFNREGVQVLDNIDKVDIMGGELEFRGLVTNDIQLFGGIGITDTEIKKYETFPEQVGNHTPNSSQYTINLGAQYGFDVGPMDAALRLGMERRGRKYWDSDNVESQAPITLYNARLTLQKGDFQVSLWGKNLSDERYYESYLEVDNIQNNTLTWLDDVGSLGQPRSFGLDVRYDF
uniref:Iron complex outermembrane recepter protein n=1 Tax=Candidatus Kentrum sp. UNK TaxID=2126344 RepID=A0A451A4A1_9GAMM|nr:MAG: iron complex outermembrane recepter protein [Candidatus Kentron sp. UNK]VFK69499.1 MAG: iron complex outermembrane recepter protein [Candidatus Kentron sp. UNK]